MDTLCFALVCGRINLWAELGQVMRLEFSQALLFKVLCSRNKLLQVHFNYQAQRFQTLIVNIDLKRAKKIESVNSTKPCCHKAQS